MSSSKAPVLFLPGDHDINEIYWGSCFLGVKCGTCKTRMQQAYKKLAVVTKQ